MSQNPHHMITVRKAVSTDRSFIRDSNLAMARETEDRGLSPERLDAGVSAGLEDSRKGQYWIAELESEPAGCLLVTREWSDWRNGWFLWIQSVYVSSEFRGKGVYRRLYEAVKEDARKLSEPVCGFRLYVERTNTGAQSVYSKLGMKCTTYDLYEEELTT